MENKISTSKIKSNFRGINQVNIKKEHRRACLTVSLNQKNEQGQKLKAIIEKANKSFASFDIMLCDSLNRFNLVIEHGLTFDEAEILAIKMGDEWIANNETFLENLKIPGKIIRWNEWRLNPNFELILNQVNQLVQNDSACKKICETIALEYGVKPGYVPNVHS